MADAGVGDAVAAGFAQVAAEALAGGVVGFEDGGAGDVRGRLQSSR